MAGKSVAKRPRASIRGVNVLERAETRRRIINLRRRGLTIDQIRDALIAGEDGEQAKKLHRSTIAAVIKTYLDAVDQETSESVEQLRTMENERLDELTAAFGPAARAGDPKAAAVLLRVSERRARMNGLDAAQRVTHDVRHTLLEELGTDADELQRERDAWLASNTVDGEALDITADLAP